MTVSGSSRQRKRQILAAAHLLAIGMIAIGLSAPASAEYDPFVTTADGASATPAATSNNGQRDPLVTIAAKGSAVILLNAERTNEYDPFDLPTTAAHEVAPCILQIGEPAPGNLLPSPVVAPNEDVWISAPIDQLSTKIGLPSGPVPRDYAAERPPVDAPYMDALCASRGWPMIGYQWKASCLCHQPLYFEEINLERYGYGCCDCLQYGASAAHFFATVPALPYLMAVDCPCECDYTLGHYRPGSCPPWRFHWPPCCDTLAAASEAGVLTGLIFLIP